MWQVYSGRWCGLEELQTKVREDFTIMKKAPLAFVGLMPAECLNSCLECGSVEGTLNRRRSFSILVKSSRTFLYSCNADRTSANRPGNANPAFK